MRSLPDLPVSLPLAQAYDAWVWAFTNEIRLVGATFQFKGHEFQTEPMQADTRLVSVRKATQMAFTERAVLKVLHAMIHRRWPVGCLYLFPTLDTVTDLSASRFNPLIGDNPDAIGQYVRDTNRANLKRVGDGFLYFRSGRLGQEIQTRQIVLPRADLDIVQKFARHCNAIAKKVEEDEETGSKRYICIRLKPEDHFRLANCYEAMARHDAPNWLFRELQ